MGFFDLSFLRLRKRIFTGYLLIGFMTLLIILFSYFSIKQLFNEFQRFIAYSENAQIGLTLSRDVTELQRSAELYLHDGLVSAEKQVEYIYDNILHLISRFRSDDKNLSAEGMDKINQRLHNFYMAFEQVKIERKKQEILINVEIRQHAMNLETLLNDLQAYQVIAGSALLSNLTAQLLNQVLVIEKNTYHYFDSLDGKLIGETRKVISHSQDIIDELQRQQLNTSAHNILNETEITMEALQDAISEAVQRTRGYLYLVNVVMAAEAYEIRYQSEKLSTLVKQEMRDIELEITSVIKQVTSSVLAVSLLVLMVIGLLSYSIGRSIADPILRLTEIFKQLSRGRSQGPITGLGSHDEIGELSSAAEVFREKNTELHELLLNYQELSENLEHKVNERTHELQVVNAKLAALSHTDGLTGLANRRHFDEALIREWSRSSRSKLPLSLIMIDVDFFKRYNDHYGHQAGDDCLQKVARLLETCLKRDTDVAARYGGEEFVVILQDTGIRMAMKIAEAIRVETENLNLIHEKSPMKRVTLSLGIAASIPGHQLADRDELIRLADEALYQSKESGRNRVTLASHDQPRSKNDVS